MQPPSPQRFTRALSALAALGALALIASQVLAWVSVRRAARAADQGEAAVLLASAEYHLRSLQRAPEQVDLDAFLDARSDAGLTYLAVRHRGRLLEAGTARLTGPRRPGFRRGKGRTQMSQALPLPPARRPVPDEGAPLDDGPPGDFGPPHDGPPDWHAGMGPPPHGRFAPPRFGMGPPRRRSHMRPPREGMRPPREGMRPLSSAADVAASEGEPAGPPLLTVEVAPTLSPAMMRDAYRGLLGSGFAALLFLGLAFALRLIGWQREEALRAAEQHKHLATIGEMSAVIAHQIRNPLAALKGHGQLLQETLPDDDRANAKAERIVHEAKRLEELTDSLLAFVRSGELQLAETELVSLIWDAARVLPDREIQLTVEPEGSDVPIEADRVRLQQAVENIIINAAQMSEAPVEVRVLNLGRNVEIHIADRGPGIEPGQEETIFEPFHTTRVRGTGLGLAVARRVVVAHGGTITAANRPDEGAVFVISIPSGMRRSSMLNPVRAS